MNRSYRTVWNKALGACVAVAENASAPRGRGRGSRRAVGAKTAIAVAALAAAGVSHAGAFTASNEAELAIAIAGANAGPDASSTIDLAAGFTVTAPLAQIQKNVTIVSNGFAISANNGTQPFSVAAGSSLSFQGTVTGAGGFVKDGAGTVIFTGAGSTTGGGISVLGGELRVEGGATLGTGGLPTVAVTGDNARLVVTGTGSAVTLTSGSTVVGSAAGSTLEVSAGASYGGLNSIALGNVAGTIGNLTAQGAGTTVSVANFTATLGQANVRVLDGAAVTASGIMNLGRALGATSDGVANVTVDGPGSTLISNSVFSYHSGSLAISGGGLVQGRSLGLGGSAGDSITALVAGAGSRLASLGVLSMGVAGSASVTLSDGGTLSANNGAAAVNLATSATGAATLNIGAAAGDAAAAPGTVLASAVNGGAGTAVVNFNHNAAAYDFSVPIKGNVTVNQIGSGTTTLTGASTYTGATNVSAGTLAVNGSITSTVNVLAAGRLQGSGSVGGATVAGTIAPGNSIGTLSIAGNLAQSAGSVYEAEVDPASNASDLIHASGSATLASGAQLKVVRAGAATFGIGNRYTVLSADAGVTGTYQLAGDTQSAFVRVVDSYDANNVYLTVEKARTIGSVGGTGNEVAVGTAIDSMPAGNALSTAVTWLPNDAAARDALNQLSADIHASTRTALLEDSRFVREAAIDRLRSAACTPGGTTQAQQRPGATCTPEAGSAGTGWAQVFGSWGRIDSDGNASRLDRDIGGFVAGADTAVGAGWRAGGLVGYSRSKADTSARNSNSKTDSYHLAFYGGTQWDATALRLGLGHSWNHVETERSVAFQGFAGQLASEDDTGATQAFAEVGHRIDVGRAALEPFAGLAYVSLGSSSFAEQGGPAALYGHGDSLATTFSSLGVRASMPVGEQTRLRGMLAWRHAFGDTAPTTTQVFSGSLPFTLSGVPLAKDVAALDAGVETQLRPNLTLSASYSGQFGGGLQDHGAKLELNWKF